MILRENAMTDQVKLILLGVLILLAALIVVIMVINTRKANIKKEIEDLNIRFNTIKTTPLAFKLNKAQAMAKRNADTAEDIKVYYQKYEDAQKHIDQIGTMLEEIEDSLAGKNYAEAKEAIVIARENIEDSEKEVSDIDRFLEQFQEEETGQRENSTRLKEQFREIKLFVNENSNSLSVAYEGIEKKIEKVEDLFSQSEEYMYVNDYASSEKALAEIDTLIKDIKNCVTKLPELVSDAKGVVPTLLDEANRQFALTRQSGVYTEHLKIAEKIEKIEESLNTDLRVLNEGNITGVEENIAGYKRDLNDILSTLAEENKDFQSLKGRSDEIAANIAELRNLHNYVGAAYEKDKDRFGIENIDVYLNNEQKAIDDYQASYIALNEDIADNNKPASELMARANELFIHTEEDRNKLTKYKADFDKNTTDEERARSQLMKLQVVLNEVEVKVKEFHLPSIADTYKEDLLKGREMVTKIKELLSAVPLDIDELNKNLDESIDFIYKFYNNVNNVVGMAIMVENAIVFGNKYRSKYPEVENDLSKAEFSYLNGEYTKALTISIACMEKLFPNSKNTGYLENN